MNTILIISRSEILREGLKLCVLSGADTVIGAPTLDDVADVIDQDGLDMIILDDSEWLRDGRDIWRSGLNGPKIMVTTSTEDPALVRKILDAGADGVLHTSSPAHVARAAIGCVLAGGTYIPPLALAHPIPRSRHAGPASLTPRQTEVLDHITQGKSNKEIARLLNLTEGTVKLHVTAVLKCLGVVNRTAAAMVARMATDDAAMQMG